MHVVQRQGIGVWYYVSNHEIVLGVLIIIYILSKKWNDTIHTVISCKSFTILCSALICSFNDMLRDLYGMVWVIVMKH